jgi:hypothetical protein
MIGAVLIGGAAVFSGLIFYAVRRERRMGKDGRGGEGVLADSGSSSSDPACENGSDGGGADCGGGDGGGGGD